MGDNSVFSGLQGPDGAQGPQGIQGIQGDPGQGVPVGGTAGQRLSKIDGTDFNTEWVDPPSVFGEEFQFVQNLTRTTTTGTWTQHLRLTTTNLPAGNYLVSWSATFGNETSDKGAMARIEQDDTTTLSMNNVKAKIASGELALSFVGFRELALTGVHTFDLDIQDDGGITYMEDAQITLWRVS